MGDATERQEGATPNRGDPLEIAGLLREGEPCHHDRCKIRTPDSCLCAEAAEALTRGVEALLSERSARLAAERERDEARVAWRSATETVGAASRVYETALDGRVETKRALRDAELRADAADAAGYRRGLEEAAALRDAFVSADYGEDWDRGLQQGMDDYQAAIRALPRGSSASQGER
jgi:hypothetical protein